MPKIFVKFGVPLNLKSHTLNIYRVKYLSNIWHLFFSWGFDGIFIFWEKRKVHTTRIGLECSYNLGVGRARVQSKKNGHRNFLKIQLTKKYLKIFKSQIPSNPVQLNIYFARDLSNPEPTLNTLKWDLSNL